MMRLPMSDAAAADYTDALREAVAVRAVYAVAVHAAYAARDVAYAASDEADATYADAQAEYNRANAQVARILDTHLRA